MSHTQEHLISSQHVHLMHSQQITLKYGSHTQEQTKSVERHQEQQDHVERQKVSVNMNIFMTARN